MEKSCDASATLTINSTVNRIENVESLNMDKTKKDCFNINHFYDDILDYEAYDEPAESADSDSSTSSTKESGTKTPAATDVSNNVSKAADSNTKHAVNDNGCSDETTTEITLKSSSSSASLNEEHIQQQNNKVRIVEGNNGIISSQAEYSDVTTNGSPKHKSKEDCPVAKDPSADPIVATQKDKSPEKLVPRGLTRDPRLMLRSNKVALAATSNNPNPQLPAFISDLGKLSVPVRRSNQPVHNEKPIFQNIPPNLNRKACLPKFLKTPTLEMYGLNVVFPNLCLSFTTGKCFIDESRCKYKHEYPKGVWVAERLNIMLQSDVITVFKHYILRNVNFIQHYFQVFCQYFGQHKLHNMLAFATEHCQRIGLEWNLCYVIEGYTLCGMTYAKALQNVFSSMKQQPRSEMKFIMVEMILVSKNNDLPKFMKILEILAQDPPTRFESKHISFLLKEYKQNSTTRLYALIWAILAKCNKDNVALESIHEELEPFLSLSINTNPSSL